jgi:phage shock protein C
MRRRRRTGTMAGTKELTMTTPGPTPPPAQRRLTRSRDDRMLAGVCGGIAEYLNVDPTIVRLVTVLVGIFSAGTALIAYLIAAIIVPEAPRTP